MAECVTQEGKFEIPEGWRDATVNILEAPNATSTDRAVLKILLSRTPGSGGTLDDFVAFQTKDLVQRTPWFVEVGRFDQTVDGTLGRGLRATFREEDREFYQARVTFERGGTFLSLIVVGNAAGAKECDAVLDRVAQSVRFR